MPYQIPENPYQPIKKQYPKYTTNPPWTITEPPPTVPAEPSSQTQTQTTGQPPIWQQYGRGSKPPQWTDWPSDVAQYVNQAGKWYRDPSHPAHLVWNRRYGWQNYRDVLEQMRTGKPVGQWGLTPHMDWWEDYDITQWGLDPSLVGANKFGGGATTASPETTFPPFTTPPADYSDYGTDLGRWGYAGPMGFNPMEQEAMDFVMNMYGGTNPLETLTSAQDFYERLLSGGFGPESEQYLQDVYDPVRAEMEDLLETQSKRLGSQFAHRGGFFGGKHGYAQSELARGGTRDLASILANLKQGAYEQNIANMLTGAGGLTGLAGTQMGIGTNLLSNLLGVGEMATGREMTNRALWQDAMLREYQDWMRARGESMLPMQWLLSGMGMQTQMPFAQQPQPSPWSYLFQNMGQGASMLPFILSSGI